jgi:hypothetical protein
MADIVINLKGDAEQKAAALDKILDRCAKDTEKAQAATRKLSDELDKEGKAAEASAIKTGAISAAMGNLASAGVEKAIAKIVDELERIPEAADRSERHAQALTALGPAYQQVQRATNGAVTAEQAFAAQQRLAQEGMRVTGAELAAITGRARNFARATGGDTQAALDNLLGKLREGGEGLREFGITVHTAGTTKTQQFQEALRQLQQQQQASAPAALTAREAQEQLAASMGRVHDSVDAFLARGVGLTEFFVNLSHAIDGVTDGTRSFGEVLEDVAQGRLFGNAGQSTSADAANAYGSAIDQLRRAGVNTRAYPMAGQMAAASPEERARVMALVQRDLARVQNGARGNASAAALGRDLFGTGDALPARVGEDAPGGFDTSTSADEITRILGGATTRSARDRAAAAAARAAEQRRLQQERDRRSAAERAAALSPNVNLGGARSEFREALTSAQNEGVTDLGLGGANGDPAALRLARLRAAANETGARTGENEEARLRRLAAALRELTTEITARKTAERELNDQIRESNNAAKERSMHLSEQLRQGETDARRIQAERIQLFADERQILRDLDAAGDHSAAGEHERTQQRLQDLKEQRDAVASLLAQTEARIEQATREGATARDMNALYSERLGLMRTQAQLATETANIERQQSASLGAFKDAMTGHLEEVTGGFAEAGVAALEGSKSFDQAAQEALRATLRSLAKESIVQALKETALGIGSLAAYDYGGAVGHFSAAGAWGAVGIASGAALSAMPKPAAAPSASSPTSTRDAASGRGVGGREAGGGPLVLNFTVSGSVFTDDGITEVVSRGVNRGRAMGLIRAELH